MAHAILSLYALPLLVTLHAFAAVREVVGFKRHYGVENLNMEEQGLIYPLILIVKTNAQLKLLEAWCSLILLPSHCDHVYRIALKGAAGAFSSTALDEARMLLGEGLHEETDGQVIKSEGPDNLKHWWKMAFPNSNSNVADKHQLLAARRLLAEGDLHSDSISDAWQQGSSLERQQQGSRNQSQLKQYQHVRMQQRKQSGSQVQAWQESELGQQQEKPRLQADGSVDSVDKEGKLELLRAVGFAAQAALSRNGGFSRIIATLGSQMSQPTKGSNTSNPSAFSSPRKSSIRLVSSLDGAQKEATTPIKERDAEKDSGLARPEGVDKPNGLIENPDPGEAKPKNPETLTRLSLILEKPITKIEQLLPALWNLDRIDQVDLPLDGQYVYGSDLAPGTGSGTTIYALDSGIFKEHQEFLHWGSKGSRASFGYNFIDEDEDARDCDGHGTHVGATAIGRSVGVAKGAKLVALRVLDCSGSGTISDTVAGLEWVATNHKGPSVVIMSLGVSIGAWSKSIEHAVRSLVNEHGISVIVASGNKAMDACLVAPANMPEAITVAASDMENKFDPHEKNGREGIYRWSNTGRCVDVIAPGVEIWSACGGGGRCPNVTNDAYTWASGTSMAVPHVAALAAIYHSDHPGARPSEIKQVILRTASPGKVHDPHMLPDTPSRIVFTRSSEVLEGASYNSGGSDEVAAADMQQFWG